MATFVVAVVAQTAVAGVAENRGKMTATPVALAITNPIRTTNRGEDHRTVSATVDLAPAEAVALEGKSLRFSYAHSIPF